MGVMVGLLQSNDWITSEQVPGYADGIAAYSTKCGANDAEGSYAPPSPTPILLGKHLVKGDG